MLEQTPAGNSFGAVPLFATPFAAVNTGANRHFNERVSSLCESQRSAHALPADPSRDPLHFRSRDDFLDSPDATAGELRRLMLGNVSAVVAGLNSTGAAEFARLHIQARGWCSIVQRNGHVPAQHFPRASWFAVYCAQAGEPEAGLKGAGVLRLYERRLGSIYRDASTWELKSPYRYGNHTWSPQPGWMALFPAHVPHEVSVVRSVTSLILVFAMIRFIDASATGSVSA
ncbi:MAG TPA: hypothetical protein VFU13_07450 [Steroidobacteraceae bacterium]|nr:hypothetical protein [Steroidobacteraceae bacterium]